MKNNNFGNVFYLRIFKIEIFLPRSAVVPGVEIEGTVVDVIAVVTAVGLVTVVVSDKL